jgi:hypothetical protein
MSRVIAPRVVQHYVQQIDAPPAVVFPLLCPVRESEWLPGWQCELLHTASGLAEMDAVFATSHADGRTVWTITCHEPPARIGFVRWQPDGVLVAIDIQITSNTGGSAVAIRYCHTALDARGEQALAQLNDADWHARMTFWQESMNRWLAAHPTA